MDGETKEYLKRIESRFDAMDEKFVEMRRHFDVTREHLEGKIQLVAEGIIGVARGFEEFRRETEGNFREVRAEIKFSYDSLARRLR